MAASAIDVTWNGGMSFKTDIEGHELLLDAGSGAGGDGQGPPPKPLMLAALGGCTGMDVISILKKMRVEVDDFTVRIEAQAAEEHPKKYIKMHVIYQFKGKDLPLQKLEKAVNLSEEQYCGVSAVYREAVEMSSEIQIID